MPLLNTKEQISNWLIKEEVKRFDIAGDLSVSVAGSVNLSERRIVRLQVRFSHVEGNFICHSSHLSTLENFPLSVGGYLDIHHNKLTSLKGCTLTVKEHFNCSENKLRTLEGGPREVGASYNCIRNRLVSLQGGPDIVKGNLLVSANFLSSLQGIEEVQGRVNCNSNPLITLIGSPRMEGLLASNTLLPSLEGLQLQHIKTSFTLSHQEGFIIPELRNFYSTHKSTKNQILLRSEEKVRAFMEKLMLEQHIQDPNEFKPSTQLNKIRKI